MFNLLRSKKGAALAEYSLLVAGVMLVGAAATSLFGHKTADMMGATAAVLPGAHDDDNGPVISGKVIETTDAGLGAGGNGIALDVGTIAGARETSRLGTNLGYPDGTIGQLVLEAGSGPP